MKRHSSLLVSFALATATLATTARAEPDLTSPRILPGDAAIGAAGGIQQFPAIAAGDGAYLAAWADHRSAFADLTTGAGTRDVYAQIIGADGTPRTPLPIRVFGGLGRKEDVRVAWNGTHWLVTWQNEAPTQFSKAAALYGARVDAQGSVLDDPPLVIRKYASSSTFAYDLTSDGNGWAVAIQAPHGSEGTVEGWLVAPSGACSPAPGPLVSVSYVLLGFQLRWDGTQYLLVWDESGVKGRRLDASLAPLGAPFTVATAGASGAAIAPSPGGGFVAAWTRYLNGYWIQYRSVSAAGSLGVVTSATPASAAEANYDSSIAWNGSGYTLAWTSGLFPPSTLRYARIDAAGTLLDYGGVPIGQGVAAAFQAVASIGDGSAQLVWVDKETTPANLGDVFGTRIGPAGPDPEVAIATSTSRQGSTDLAAGGEGYLAVFSSERAGAVSILAQRVDVLGNAFDPEPIELDAGATHGHPRAAWNGSHFLVVWHDQGALGYPSWEGDDVVLGRRVAADGTLLDAAPFLVMDGGIPDVAAAGSDFLVVSRVAETTELWRIYGARVDGAGTVLDPTLLPVGGSFARYPSVASFGDRWVATWQQNVTHDNPADQVSARIVFPDGTMTGTVTVTAGSIPSVAASDNVALIAWEDEGETDLYVQTMDGNGTLGSSAVRMGSAGRQGRTTVAWTGNEFVVAWEDLRGATAFFEERGDVYGARVSETGALIDGDAGFPIATSAEDEQLPTVAASAGHFLVGFSRLVPNEPHTSVRSTFVSSAPDGCSATSYCLTSPNSVGAGATLRKSGSTSVAASDLVLHADDAPPGKFGILYYGSTRIQVPFGDGQRCVGGSIFRLPITQVAPNGTASRALDLANPPHGDRLTPGSTWNFQFWYRDSVPGGAGFNLTDALSLTFCD